MDARLLQERFGRLGVRVRVAEHDRLARRGANLPLTLDVRSDAKGEYFDIALRRGARPEVDVIDLRRREQHLLLRATAAGDKHLFLCGHDERHWFVAAVPEVRGRVSNVAGAMEALKPAEVLEAQARQGLNDKERRSRKNAAFRRQGEWFFLPAPGLVVSKHHLRHNEPLSRGTGSKPHLAEFCYRTGGETVFVCTEYPAGLRSGEYRRLLESKPKAKGWNWREMRRDAAVYVKGRIRHNDHETITLLVWHRVVMNTENQARAMSHVVFLD
jgi:hypothetical protein